MLLLSVIPWPGPSVFKISCPRDRASVVRRIVQKVKKTFEIFAFMADRSGKSFNILEVSEMDANPEEASGRAAAGVSVPRKSRHFSAPAKGETSAQAVAMDLRPVRQVFLCRKTLGCPFR